MCILSFSENMLGTNDEVSRERGIDTKWAGCRAEQLRGVGTRSLT